MGFINNKKSRYGAGNVFHTKNRPIRKQIPKLR